MSDPPRVPRPLQGPGFRPEFTLLLLYFFVFFLFFALLLALPALLEGMRTLPQAASIEEERAAGAEIARHAVKGKLLAAFLATAVAVALGAYTRVLPGIKRRR
jgi:ABC-type sulfate transport system permease component